MLYTFRKYMYMYMKYLLIEKGLALILMKNSKSYPHSCYADKKRDNVW